MNETELNPGGTCEYSADDIVERILVGMSMFQMYHFYKRPTVFMSRDIMTKLSQHTKIWNHENSGCYVTTVCDCNVKLAVGENVLYIGLDLL